MLSSQRTLSGRFHRALPSNKSPAPAFRRPVATADGATVFLHACKLGPHRVEAEGLAVRIQSRAGLALKSKSEASAAV